MLKQVGSALWVIGIWLLVVLVGGVGWIANIVKLIHMNMDTISGMLIARVIGVFVPPLGAVLGYC